MKSKLLFWVLLFFPLLVSAQTLEELKSQAYELFKKKEYEQAIPIGIKMVEAAKREFGEVHPSYALSLNSLGVLYVETAQYTKAEPLLAEAKKIFKEVLLNENHRYHITTIYNLAGLYETTKQYEKAESLYLELKEIQAKSYDTKPLEYTNSLIKLGNLYKEMGLYNKAEQPYVEAKEIRKRVLGENSSEYANSLNDLAYIYEYAGRYDTSESLYLQSMEIRKRIFGENHADYATSLNNLSVLYMKKGQYDKAEPLCLLAKEIRKTTLGEQHPDYASSLSNLATIYSDIGQYDKAESFFIQAKEIRKKILGESHPKYAATLNNLAALYKATNKYKEAESLFIETNEIIRKNYGADHPNFAIGLNNLAVVHYFMKDYSKAEQLYLQSIEISKKVLGPMHTDYANSLNNLAVLYQRMGDNNKAELLYIESKDIWGKMFGENHPYYAGGLRNLAELYGSMGKYEMAESLLLSASYIETKNIRNTFSVLSEKEKRSYIDNNITLLDINTSFVYKYRKATDSFLINNYNLLLFFKSLCLADSKKMLESVRSSRDTALLNLFAHWQANKAFLANQYTLPVNKRAERTYATEVQTEEMEKELNKKSVTFNSGQQELKINMQDVKNIIKENEAALEFVSFKLYNKFWTDSTIYGAFIITPKATSPIFVPLCEEKQLEIYFSAATGSGGIKTIYRSEVVDEANTAVLSGDSLYALVWNPLEKYLQGIKKIYYSPAGLLNRIAFHALPAGNNQLLIDKYELNRYTSTRQLALPGEVKKGKEKSISLFGDAAFTMDSSEIVKNIAANEKAAGIYTQSISRSSSKGSWNRLPGTANEIISIRSLFERNKLATSSYSLQKATEEQLKLLSGHSPDILHLATHGFFLPDPEIKKEKRIAADERNAFTNADNPMLRSGIVLSGANRVWSGMAPIEGIEDGIVTAYEISQLDLRNTDLVVLSACETALGDIKGTEGVFGLQRAFKLAGVKNMLLSLWKVPDAETAELMTAFYKYYLDGKTAREALNSAQKEMRKKYKPYYWAAFVLIE